MDTFVDMYNTLRDMRKRQLAHQVLNLAMIVCSALMIWKSLMVITSSESPVVVVLSGSMEPAFHRGDILGTGTAATPAGSGTGLIVPWPMPNAPITSGMETLTIVLEITITKEAVMPAAVTKNRYELP